MIIQLVDAFFTCYMLLLMARIMGSWFPEYQDHPFMRFVAHYTDPYLNMFRRVIPPLGMLDLSPLIAFFALNILETIVKTLIR
jgi:YggT family protein